MKWNKAETKTSFIIFLCFLLTSISWLSWEHNLLRLIPTDVSDICTMVVGYLFQAAGIGVYALVLKKRRDWNKRLVIAALILHTVFLIPSVLGGNAVAVVIFGILMNFCCGIIAGVYLKCLSDYVGKEHKASVFGAGYGLSVLAAWLISLIGGGRLYYSGWVLAVCIALTAAAFAVLLRDIDVIEEQRDESGGIYSDFSSWDKGKIFIVGALVLLFSIVNSSGFAFPSSDISGAVNIEFSRLIYGMSLIIAGFVTDMERKYGAICAMAALVVPFIIISLQGGVTTALVLWALGYFAFGFYSVFRIIIFSDIASDSGKELFYLSGFGLLLGRVGDALGEVICVAFSDRPELLVGVTAALFVGAVFVFFKAYSFLYAPLAVGEQSGEEKFYRFSSQHDLSAREREVLKLLLDEKTNAEIADALCISENTVKFHLRNLFQKTGSKNRKELIAEFYANSL